MAAAAVLYLACGAFFILLLALLLAYLLEPAVAFVEKHSKLGRNNRALAIAQVYVVGTVAVIAIAYKLGPSLIAQLRNFSAAIPQLLKGSSTGQRGSATATLTLSAQQLKAWLGYNQETIAGLLESEPNRNMGNKDRRLHCRNYNHALTPVCDGRHGIIDVSAKKSPLAGNASLNTSIPHEEVGDIRRSSGQAELGAAYICGEVSLRRSSDSSERRLLPGWKLSYTSPHTFRE